MESKLGIGDHVSWNFEAARVSGTITRVQTAEFKANGHTHHASGSAAIRD